MPQKRTNGMPQNRANGARKRKQKAVRGPAWFAGRLLVLLYLFAAFVFTIILVSSKLIPNRFLIIVLMILGLMLALLSPGMEKWNRRFFVVMLSLMVLCVAVGMGEQVFALSPEGMLGNKLCLFVESLLASLLPPLLTVYLPRPLPLYLSRKADGLSASL